MKNTHRKKQPISRTASYKRWKKQLDALHKGDFVTIKRLAREATIEREMKHFPLFVSIGEQIHV